ncbi:hypothetical protein, partial [Mycolicibacterium phlei]
MSRTVAVVWHVSSCVVAGVLYFFFVLPRWPELMGQTPHTLGTVLRIVVGALIGLSALPVLFTLLRTRRPEFRTPKLALNLRAWSIGLHVLAGVLIIGAAISEIWLSLDDAGRWLFGIYAAAAAIALLGIFAFYLAWVAEMPPPPPKPVKPRSQRRRGRKATEESTGAAEAAEEPEETSSADEADGDKADGDKADEKAEETEPASEQADEDTPAENGGGKLRNRRRRRLRGGVAVE